MSLINILYLYIISFGEKIIPNQNLSCINKMLYIRKLLGSTKHQSNIKHNLVILFLSFHGLALSLPQSHYQILNQMYLFLNPGFCYQAGNPFLSFPELVFSLPQQNLWRIIQHQQPPLPLLLQTNPHNFLIFLLILLTQV